MINTSVVVEDNQVVRLILEFLDSRKLHNTMRSLEKEAGIANCGFSDDILFLRELVLDGEWEAILIFAQPFEGIADKSFMEVLYFKSGFGGNSTSYSIEDLIKCLNQLEEDCPNKAEYSKLCWLLTVPNLPEQPEYRDWNPATARIDCFEQILDLLRKSPRRDDAEILSRSLSLSGRPATADLASHLSALETGRNSGAISNNRPHSTLPLKGVSHSYNEFHYKGYPEKEPTTYAANNGLREEGKLENEGGRLTQTGVSGNNSNGVEPVHKPTQPFGGNHATEPSRDHEGIHALKEQQQQNVLKQLEAYERQKQELERQLLELSLRETMSGKPNGEGDAMSELPGKRPESSESFKPFKRNI
ncbi:WD repeat-containing protein 47 [Desmophyllum pertusum]|uniref:WD repeat-containing protein 47 n=1 Tax=Desmophyllum pertusum TaxID=174260 RepID=A0A9W9YZH7_9CNID|nr:WD repeat-containing protein 47 [Desmophyllum pertusum]